MKKKPLAVHLLNKINDAFSKRRRFEFFETMKLVRFNRLRFIGVPVLRIGISRDKGSPKYTRTLLARIGVSLT